MSIKEAIEKELKLEKRILSKITVNYRIADSGVLLCRVGNGRTMFYIRDKKKNMKKAKYVSRKEFWKAEMLYRECVKAEIVKALNSNIKALEKAIRNIEEYDVESVVNRMPKAYKNIRDFLNQKGIKDALQKIDSLSKDNVKYIVKNDECQTEDSKDDADVPQSENPKDRAGLKFKTSFGLMVRSKNELLIAEALYTAGVKFLYEARLELVEGIGDAATNRETYNMEALFPDFTIILPDGERLYWEHLGMWENQGYREDNVRRLTLYFSNGIYPPKNLILTVDGNKMPFDNSAVWRIIEGQILSRY